MPRDSFSHSATTRASRDQVWAVLQEPETWEGVAGVDHVQDPVFDVDGSLRGFRFQSVVAGKKFLGRADPGPREENQLMVWDIETSDLAGSVVVELFNARPGTRVDVTVNVESRGTLSSVFFPLIRSAIGDGFPKTVEDFASSLG